MSFAINGAHVSISTVAVLGDIAIAIPGIRGVQTVPGADLSAVKDLKDAGGSVACDNVDGSVTGDNVGGSVACDNVGGSVACDNVGGSVTGDDPAGSLDC